VTIEEREARLVTPTWQDRERRILDHVVWVWEQNERAEVADVAEALGLDYALTVRVVDELRRMANSQVSR
jgi:erythromycin esterase-like protein